MRALSDLLKSMGLEIEMLEVDTRHLPSRWVYKFYARRNGSRVEGWIEVSWRDSKPEIKRVVLE